PKLPETQESWFLGETRILAPSPSAFSIDGMRSAQKRRPTRPVSSKGCLEKSSRCVLAAAPVVESTYHRHSYRKQQQGTGLRNRGDSCPRACYLAGIVGYKVNVIQLLARTRKCKHTRSQIVGGKEGNRPHVEGIARRRDIGSRPVGREVRHRTAI